MIRAMVGIVVATVVLPGCDAALAPDRGVPPITAVAIEAPALSLAPEEALPLEALATDSAGRVRNPGTVRWWSDDTLIARVDLHGTVTGVRPGRVRILAEAAGILVWTELTVLDQLIATSLALGHHHACGRTPAGGVVCWGASDDGQLGLEVLRESAVPVRVTGIGTADAVAAGSLHTCALVETQVWCWGQQDRGRLGNGDLAIRSVASPESVVTAERFDVLAAGAAHSCGLTGNGEPWCWGQNDSGQVNPAMPESGVSQPTRVAVDGPMMALELERDRGDGHYSCAVDAGQALWCWGAVPGEDTVRTPRPVLPGRQVTDVGAGRHLCVVDTVDLLWCWGANGSGQAGQGGTTVPAPQMVFPERRFVRVAVSREWTCGVTPDAELLCWGRPPLVAFAPEPVPVAPDHRVRDVVMSHDFACFLDERSHVWCWGINDAGQLGDGSRSTSSTPVPVRAAR